MRQDTLEMRKRIVEVMSIRVLARQLHNYLTMPDCHAIKANKIEQAKFDELKKLLEMN
jgi:hypothetical protein